jgi:sulfite reductase alpha subunit-like flavoprotein
MAQEVTFMMLRVVLFEIYKHYRLRLAPGATVTKNTVVTTKPAQVPIIRLPREPRRIPPGPATSQDRAPAQDHAPVQAPPPAQARPPAPGWGQPTEIPRTSAYRHLVIAYGSNFGANKELAERFAERSHFHGYTSDVMTLNELAESPARTQPWLLVVMTSTYTSNPPANAAAFKAWLEHTEPGSPTWRACRYLVWGLGNSQWNAFLAFPRYVHKKLFHLQEDATKPMIFVSAGTGFAPMRAFLWERAAMKRAGIALAEAALFNGIRSTSLGYIYRDEIEHFAAEGVLDHVHIATSREPPGCHDYVQDRIREQGALVWRLLAAGGYAYICGSQPMRDAIRTAFVDVAAEHGALPRERAAAYLDELETTARYRPDLWG